MKVFSFTLLFILVSCQYAIANIITYNGCRYDCHEETFSYSKTYSTVKEIKHHDLIKDFMYVERTSTPVIGPDEVLHDYKDYKDWDKIVDATNKGEKTGYKVENNKLFTIAGKRYLRCNDPANEKWIKKWVEKVEVMKPVDWSEFITITNEEFFTLSKWVCFPLRDLTYHHYGGYHYHHEYNNPPIGTQPVPEPSTMLLFGAGLIGLASIKNRWK